MLRLPSQFQSRVFVMPHLSYRSYAWLLASSAGAVSLTERSRKPPTLLILRR